MSSPKQKPGSSFQAYQTPKIFIQATKKLLGINEFSWDVAADKDNTQSPYGYFSETDSAFNYAWISFCYTKEEDSWLWLNPPYSNIGEWTEKCSAESKNGAKIALLVPASVGANWYKKWVHNQAYVLYLNGRLAFIPDKPNWLYPKDLMLCLYNGWAVGSNVWSWKKEIKDA